MNEAASAPRFSRLTKHVLLGGLFGGVLSVIPVLQVLNCLLCLVNISGIVLALWMYLKARPEDTVSVGESAGFGAIAGAVAGLISSAVTLLSFDTEMLASLMENFPNQEGALAGAGIGSSALIAIAVPVTIALFAGFGALGAALAMQLLFKPRIRRP